MRVETKVHRLGLGAPYLFKPSPFDVREREHISKRKVAPFVPFLQRAGRLYVGI